MDKLTSLKINVLDLGNKLLYWLLLVRELSLIRANKHANKAARGQDSIQILFSLQAFLSKTVMAFTEQQQQQKENSLSLKPQVDKVLFNSENEFSEPLGIGDNPI